MSPRCGSAPAARRASAPASDRVNPNTWWPAPISSGMIAVPMNPVAPVRKTRMVCAPLSSATHGQAGV